MPLSKLSTTLILCNLLLSIPFSAQEIPNEIKDLYRASVDRSLSDEFNAHRKENKVDLKKWIYRRTKNSGASATFVQEKDGRLICKGIKAKKRAGGIVSRKYKQYGWYVVRWKTTGINPNARSAWHPSIWSGQTNGQHAKTADFKRIPNAKGGWLEFDMVEFETHRPHAVWSADAPARVYAPSLNKLVKVNDANGKALGYKKAVMIEKVSSGFSDWQIWGLEYHPDYLQMWKKEGKVWTKQGRLIKFNNQKPSLNSIPKSCRKPMFWYLGNLYLPHGKIPIKKSEITDSTLEVDWFRFHPFKK